MYWLCTNSEAIFLQNRKFRWESWGSFYMIVIQ